MPTRNPTKLQSHIKRWTGCERCDLCETRRKIVLLEGKFPCDVLFIGEAPGPSEDMLGRPFIGPAGHLLRWMMKQAGFDVADHDIEPLRVGFTNLVACIPRGEDGKKFTEPPGYALQECSDRVKELIEIAQPKLIVMAGGLAAKWVPKILKNIPRDPPDLLKIIHPAAILRLKEQKGMYQYHTAVQKTVAELSDAIIEEPFQNEIEARRRAR